MFLLVSLSFINGSTLDKTDTNLQQFLLHQFPLCTKIVSLQLNNKTIENVLSKIIGGHISKIYEDRSGTQTVLCKDIIQYV